MCILTKDEYRKIQLSVLIMVDMIIVISGVNLVWEVGVNLEMKHILCIIHILEMHTQKHI